ncbi:MAG TPA: enoyl-CoA hydratase-related protein [Nitrososphaeraceae archaeon]|nr:enoyl-CoA hydratase-related protein [Nitrososphaeraceae archaeon]
MKHVLVEKAFDIAIVKINRPEVLNALNFELVSELIEIFNNIISDDKINAVILTGVGNKAFCAGGDLNQVIKMDPIQAEKYASHVHYLLNTIENLEKPVIAAINGYALGGGCQLALACDIRIASANAKIGQTEVKIGIPPGWGGTQRLARIVGMAKAKELIYTGKIICAKEAKEINLFNMVISLDNSHSLVFNDKKNINSQELNILLNAKLIEESIKFTRTITVNDRFAIKISKSLINKSRDINIESGLTLERFGCALCFTKNDNEKKKFSSVK